MTFGCPSVGNNDFVEFLAKKAGANWELIAHPGDPVPYLPPSNALLKHTWVHPTIFGWILSLAYLALWKPYAWCYGVEFSGCWNDASNHVPINWTDPDGGLWISKHDMPMHEKQMKTSDSENCANSCARG